MLNFINLFSKKSAFQESESRFYPLTNSVSELKELSRTDYLKLYQGWVYLCASTIAGSMWELKYWLKSVNWEKEIQHPNMRLVNQELIETITYHLLLTGSAFFMKQYVGRSIDELSFMRSDLVHIEEDSAWRLLNYRYTPNNQYILQKDDVIHFFMFNPLRTYPFEIKWVWPVSAIAVQAEMDKTANRWNWNFFKNWASIGSMLSTDQSMSPENKELLIRKWKQQFQGVANGHSVAVLDNWLKYESVPNSKKEMDFVESRRFTRDEIFAIFKVPPAVIWVTDNANRASSQVAIDTYYRVCIKPIADRIAETITKELFAGIGKFEFVNVIPTDVNELREDFKTGAITLNEYRKARWFNEITWGDTIGGVLAEKPISEDIKSIEIEIKKELWNHSMLVTKIEREMIGQKKWENKVKRTTFYEQKLISKINNVFEAQRRDVIESLHEKKSVRLDKISKLKWRLLWVTSLMDEYKEVMMNEWTMALAEVGVTSIFQIGNPRINKYVQSSLSLLAKSADEHTLEIIEAVIKQGNEEWMSASDIWFKISQQFEDFSRTRANKIARTEITTISSFAEIDAWEQSGVVTAKEWYTALDERRCERCGALHGKVIPLTENFFKKWDEFKWIKFDYRDINGPACHPQCRCTLLAILK